MFGNIRRHPRELSLPEKTVILSFDDGPVSNGQSMELLDTLGEEGVTAAFCLVGNRIPGNEGVVRRIGEEGHLIVNHGNLHKVPESFSDEAFLNDMDAFDRAVAQALREPAWTSTHYRPPGGTWNSRIARLLSESGRHGMPVTCFTLDFLRFPFRRWIILHAMLTNLRKNGGGIFLLHEAVVPLTGEKQPAPPRAGRAWVAALVADFVVKARAEGFVFPQGEAFHKCVNGLSKFD